MPVYRNSYKNTLNDFDKFIGNKNIAKRWEFLLPQVRDDKKDLVAMALEISEKYCMNPSNFSTSNDTLLEIRDIQIAWPIIKIFTKTEKSFNYKTLEKAVIKLINNFFENRMNYKNKNKFYFIRTYNL